MRNFKVLFPTDKGIRELDIEADKLSDKGDRIALLKQNPDDITEFIIIATFPGHCAAYEVL